MVDFQKAVPGHRMSDACMEEIADRIRISFRAPEALVPTVCVSQDSDNIATKEPDGCIRVQRDTSHSEQRDVAVPSPVTEAGDTYLIPVTYYRINGIILEGGNIVPLPYGGQTSTNDNSTPSDPSDDTYAYPSDLAEFVDNLNDQTSNFTWAVSGGQLVVTSDLGATVSAVIAGGVAEEDATSVVNATALEGEVPGDVTLTFQAAHVEQGVDYQSLFDLSLDVTPGDGFDKAWVTEITSDRVTAKITRVSRALSATLRCFTPASRESATEF